MSDDVGKMNDGDEFVWEDDAPASDRAHHPLLDVAAIRERIRKGEERLRFLEERRRLRERKTRSGPEAA